MAKNTYIFEGAIDSEFHFTLMKNFFQIVETDSLKLRDKNRTPLDNQREGEYFASFTRSKNANASSYAKNLTGNGTINYRGFIVRIEFDGQSLMSDVRNVSIKQFDYYGQERLKKERLQNGQVKEGIVRRGDYYTDSEDEMEDYITTKDGGTLFIENISKYVKRVDIWCPVPSDSENIQKILRRDCTLLSTVLKDAKWAPLIHIYNNFNMFNFQKNEITFDDVFKMYHPEKFQQEKIRISESELRRMILEAIDNTLKQDNQISVEPEKAEVPRETANSVAPSVGNGQIKRPAIGKNSLKLIPFLIQDIRQIKFGGLDYFMNKPGSWYGVPEEKMTLLRQANEQIQNAEKLLVSFMSGINLQDD